MLNNVQYFIGEPVQIGNLYAQIIGTYETGRKSSHTVYSDCPDDFAPNGYYEKRVTQPHRITIIRLTEKEWSNNYA